MIISHGYFLYIYRPNPGPQPCPPPPASPHVLPASKPPRPDSSIFLALTSRDPFLPARHEAPGGQALPRPPGIPPRRQNGARELWGWRPPHTTCTRLRCDMGAGVTGPKLGEKSVRAGRGHPWNPPLTLAKAIPPWEVNLTTPHPLSLSPASRQNEEHPRGREGVPVPGVGVGVGRRGRHLRVRLIRTEHQS